MQFIQRQDTEWNIIINTLEMDERVIIQKEKKSWLEDKGPVLLIW